MRNGQTLNDINVCRPERGHSRWEMWVRSCRKSTSRPSGHAGNRPKRNSDTASGPQSFEDLCVGLNYDDHLEESGLNKPVYPESFARFATSLIAHREPIRQPFESFTLDYEAELAVVIGRRGRRISRDRALDYAAGYSLFNDATIREFQLLTPQWTMGKNFDATGAFGPWLVTPDALSAGAQGLHIQGRLNGRVMQDASTNQLIFSVPALIEMISVAISLEPGDVIITGTPGGVGAARKPPVIHAAGRCFRSGDREVGCLEQPRSPRVAGGGAGSMRKLFSATPGAHGTGRWAAKVRCSLRFSG